jgi:MscS family membrane protein
MKRIPVPLSILILVTMVFGLMAVFSEVGFAHPGLSPSLQEEETPPPPTDKPASEEAQPLGDTPDVTPEFEFTPAPTRTPLPSASQDDESYSESELFILEGPLTEWISDLAASYGFDSIYFLGLSVEDWINIAVSIVFFLAIYYLGRWLLFRVLKRLLKKTPFEADVKLLELVRPQINWFVVTLALQLSLARLTFLGSSLRVLLNQGFFVAYLTILTAFLWKVIDFGMDAFLRHERSEEDVQRLQPIYMVVKRLIQALLLVGYGSVFLSYFGIDITAFAAALGIGGLALSLAAQDTLADAISGFLILIDQPFRVGDRIEISGLGTWGDVVDIGTRTTRIRTRDNRLVIVPNSAIAKDQVINYTFPDPRYRVQIEVGIDYASDLKLAREAAIHAIKDVEGVLLEKPIDALFVDFGDSTITFRIRWWIDSYVDTRRMFDKVNEALLKGFNEAGIKLPNMTYDLNLKVDEGNVRQFSEATGRDRPEGKPDQASEGDQ